MKLATIAIVGASGLVGQCLAEILTNKLMQHKIVLFGNNSVGRKFCYLGKTYTVQHIDQLAKADVDFAMFMANEEVARQYVPQLTQRGIVCIDNSPAFRLKKSVPLIVPQINGNKIGCAKLIANPNCTTIQVAIALHALASLQPTHITVATYQAASGAGKDGLDDLTERRTYGKLRSFAHPIWDNVLGQIGSLQPNGHTSEEEKMRNECAKILDLPHLCVNSFCARVPVTVGHCAFVNVKFQKTVDANQAKQLLKKEKDLLLYDDGQLPMPSVLRHTHFVGVGRVCEDGDGGLNMFVVADNLLRGAAYNAYQILQVCLQNNGEKI